MIAKCIKGKGFRGAAAYDLQPHKSLLLETNMAGRTPRALATEFGAIRALRPNLSKAVCHVSLSLHPEESLSDEQWCEAAHSWLQGMGFVNNQYVISRHTDAAHAHIHILVNRIALDGKVVSDAHDYRRQEKIMRELEQRFSLRQVRSSRETLRAALTKGEIEHALRTGEASTRMNLQKIIDAALTQKIALNAFCQKLAAQGVTVRLNKASTGFVSGISFALGDVTFKGSKLGKGYTWGALQLRGLLHEQDRRIEEYEQGIGSDNATSPAERDRSDKDRSKPDGSELAGRSTNQELTGADSAFTRIAEKYLSGRAGDRNRSSPSKGLSR